MFQVQALGLWVFGAGGEDLGFEGNQVSLGGVK